jgi:hypothetical protein
MGITSWSSPNAIEQSGVLEAVARLSNEILDCPLCVYRIVAETETFSFGGVNFPPREFYIYIPNNLVRPTPSLIVKFNDNTPLLFIQEELKTRIAEIRIAYTINGLMSEVGMIQIACSNGETKTVTIRIAEFRFSEGITL